MARSLNLEYVSLQLKSHWEFR